MVDRAGGGDVEDRPAGVAQPRAEVGLVGVDEEVGVEVADLFGGRAADQHRAGLDPADLVGFLAAGLGDQAPVQEEGRGERGAPAGEPPGARGGAAVGVQELRSGRRRTRFGVQRVDQRLRCIPGSARRPRSAAARTRRAPRAAGASRWRPCPRGARAAIRRTSPVARARTASADPSSDALSRTSVSDSTPAGVVRLDRAEAGEQIVPAVGVHHAVAELHGQNAAPCAFRSSTRPLTRPLTTTPWRGSLARAGAEVELVTCEFPYGSVPRERGYEVTELFYRRSSDGGNQGPPLPARGRARAGDAPPPSRTRESADVVHYQWLPIPRLDRRLLADVHPRVFTMHSRFPEPDAGSLASYAALLERMDGVVAHSRHGADRLVSQFGVDPGRIEVIPHGAFDYLTRQEHEDPLPAEPGGSRGPGDPRLRPDPSLQGDRRAARSLRADAPGRRAVGGRPPDGPDGAPRGPWPTPRRAA